MKKAYPKMMTDLNEISTAAGVKAYRELVFSDPVKDEEGFLFIDESDEKIDFWTARYAQLVADCFTAPVGVHPIGANGFGAFALEDIPVGTMVGEYTGDVIDANVLQTGSGYFFTYPVTPPNSMWAMFTCALHGGNITRYINHSWDPNVSWVRVDQGGVAHVVYKTDRDLKKGDQLFIDYAEGYWLRNKVKPVELGRRIEAFV